MVSRAVKLASARRRRGAAGSELPLTPTAYAFVGDVDILGLWPLVGRRRAGRQVVPRAVSRVSIRLHRPVAWSDGNND